MVKRRNKTKNNSNMTQVAISSIVFILSTAVLFINNLSDLLIKFNLQTSINIVAWVGIAISILWWIFLVSTNKIFK